MALVHCVLILNISQEMIKSWFLSWHGQNDHVRATYSHLFHFTGLTTPSHDKVSLASIARCFHGNLWRAAAVSGWAETLQMHSPQLEWVMTRRTLVPQRIRREGVSYSENTWGKKGSAEDDWRTSVKRTRCGWKIEHLKPPCNCILIMHMEGNIRSDHSPPLDT